LFLSPGGNIDRNPRATAGAKRGMSGAETRFAGGPGIAGTPGVTNHLRGPAAWAVLLGSVGIVGAVAAVSTWESPLPTLAARIQGGRFLGRGEGVLQHRVNDCGPAALADCLRRLGESVPYPDPQSGVRLGPRGCGFRELTAEAERYGRPAEHHRVGPGEIDAVAPPAVLYLRRGHFVVYLGPGDDGEEVLLHDPAVGRVAMSRAGLRRSWTGDVMEFRAPGTGSSSQGAGSGSP